MLHAPGSSSTTRDPDARELDVVGSGVVPRRETQIVGTLHDRDRQLHMEGRALPLAPSLTADTDPPWSSTICFTIARPSLRPPCSRVVEESACRKRLEDVRQELLAHAEARCP